MNFMDFPRRSGILLHPTSLPGEYGIGDIGPQAFSFIDFLKAAGQSYWQILPLGPTGYGDSPYSCYSAFAGNTLLISPELLVEDGFLEAAELRDHPKFPEGKVDYGGVYEWKNEILSLVAERYKTNTDHKTREQVERFHKENGWWLEDYALYRAIRASNHNAPWFEWPAPLKLRDKPAMTAAARKLSDEVEAQKLYQYLFFRQWTSLRDYASKHGVHIIGDIPIFVALDSADVWCNQEQFKLNPDGSPRVVAGVPPDFFSPTGQLWGNPVYDWEAMRDDNFNWWAARVAFTLRTVDIVRLDHFRGFGAVWEVPGTHKTAENGHWVTAPGNDLFSAVKHQLGGLPAIVEDLGVITPDVIEIRDHFGFPGMKVLQFAFGGDPNDQYLPHNYDRNCVVYTGTHDNDTVVGWWKSQILPGSKRGARRLSNQGRFCSEYLDSDGTEIHWDFIRAAWSSVANTSIAQMQDVLGIGSRGRMNLPASTSGNWFWRFKERELTPKVRERLKELTDLYGRSAPKPG